MKYRVGRYTTGISIVVIGLLLLLSSMERFAWTEGWMNYWPLILIGYGIEYLFVGRKGEKASFDVSGAILVGFLFIATSFISLFGLAFIDGEFNFDQVLQTIEGEPIVMSSQGIDDLFIKTTNGKISVQPSFDDQVHVKVIYKLRSSSDREAERKMKEIKVDVRKEGKRLIAEVKQPNKVFVIGPISSYVAADIEIMTPNHLVVEARTTNGKIEVDGMENLKELSSTNGKIVVGNSKGDTRLNTTNGGLEVRNFSGALHGGTTNGSVDVSGEVLGHWKLTTTNGRMTVTVPESGSYNYNITTNNGGIHVPTVLVDGRQSKNRYSGKYQGGRYNLTLRTTNGSVNVNFE